MENKDKEWTLSRNYKDWVGKLKKTKKIRRSVKNDLCAGKSGICKSNIGIPRKYMPQFTLRRSPFSQNPIKKFRKYVKGKYGVKSSNGERTADELKPSQGEINRIRVDALIEDNIIDTMEVPLVISRDNYIVDGHHRWAAFRMAAPKKPMKVVIIDAPVKDVLGMAVEWGAETHTF
jgi:hypothetical protein